MRAGARGFKPENVDRSLLALRSPRGGGITTLAEWTCPGSVVRQYAC